MYLIKQSVNGIEEAVNNCKDLFAITQETFEHAKHTFISESENLYGMKIFKLNENMSIALFNSNGDYFCANVTDREFKELLAEVSKSDNTIIKE